jgi:hypothetical protein
MSQLSLNLLAAKLHNNIKALTKTRKDVENNIPGTMIVPAHHNHGVSK